MSWEGLLRGAREIAQKNGIGSLLLGFHDQVEVVPLAGCIEVYGIDLGAPDFLTRFDSKALPDLFMRHGVVIEAAKRMTMRGVELRGQGRFDAAFLCYRFALVVALEIQQLPGVRANCSNLWQLFESIRDARRGQDERGRPTQSTVEPAVIGALDTLVATLRENCDCLAERVRGWAERLDATGDTRGSLVAWHALKRLLNVAGRSEQTRELLRDIRHHALALGEHGLLREAIFEELAQSTTEEITLALFGKDAPIEKGFTEVWNTYQEERQRAAVAQPSANEERACRAAVKALEHVRAHSVSAGGAFGHRLSYGTSRLVQPPGRDWVEIFLARNDHAAACEAAERLRCRALCDWMARTHATHRLRVRPDVHGSLGEVNPATLPEFAAVAAAQQMPLLMYFATRGCCWAWLQSTRGELISTPIEGVDEPLATLRSLLPSLRSRERTGRAGLTRNFVIEGEPPAADRLRECLRSVYRILFPPLIRDALQREPSRLLLVTDGALDLVPFCALENEAGVFLIESHELLYWPSVTAGLLLDPHGHGRARADAFVAPEDPPFVSRSDMRRLRTGRTQGARQGFHVVLGDPDYTTGFDASDQGGRKLRVRFAPLPGSRKEAEEIARLLGTTARVGGEATATRFIDLQGSRRTLAGILHIAAHGVLDSAHPEDSFLALSGGPVTVRTLLEFDPGVQADLVMLSACQTGAGYQHPDSLISLANAFHIAGARAVGATLWRIPDAATVRLMTGFYEALQRGENLSAALSISQLAMLREDPNPYSWAAFKISGSNRNPLEARVT
jgi:CHAT domain-containing protein